MTNLNSTNINTATTTKKIKGFEVTIQLPSSKKELWTAKMVKERIAEETKIIAEAQSRLNTWNSLKTKAEAVGVVFN